MGTFLLRAAGEWVPDDMGRIGRIQFQADCR